MTVLILTSEEDATADYLIERAEAQQVSIFRCNTERFTDKYRFHTVIDRNELNIQFTDALGRTVSAAKLTGVWYRRPIAPELPGVDSAMQRYIAAEYLTFIRGALPELGLRWMSHPLRLLAAENKLHQLYTARQCGLTVPATIITNSTAALQSHGFADGDCVMKALNSAHIPASPQQKLIYTTQLPPLDQIGDSALAASPIIIQKRVEKGFDVRMTLVDDEYFAARIDPTDGRSNLDWRENSDNGNVKFTRISAPAEVLQGTRKLLSRLSISFAAMDFIVSRDGTWHFLELNPNGQWAWLDPTFDRSISAAIIRFLTGTTS